MSSARLTFNPFTGTFDYIYPEDHHGGFYCIPEGLTVKIEEWKTMFSLQYTVIEGSLVIDGMLGVIE